MSKTGVVNHRRQKIMEIENVSPSTEQETSAPPPKKNPGSAPAKDVEAELIRFSTIRVLITKWPFSRYIERDNPYYGYYD